MGVKANKVPGKRSGNDAANRSFAWKMISPTAFILGLLLGIPLLLSIYLSMTKDKLGTGFGEFIFLGNYLKLMSSDQFWTSFWLSVLFTVIFMLSSTMIGLGMAVAIENAPVGKRVMQALLILPWATPWVVVGILWNRFTSDATGPSLASFLVWLGVLEPSESLLASPFWALVIVIIAATWRQSCFAALLFIAGLQTVPPSIIEAGKVDGANAWRRFWQIVMPFIAPTTGTIIIINLIYGFLQFDVIFSLTGGGPAGATKTLPILIYETLYNSTKMGTGTAISMVLALLALVCGLVVVRLTARREDYV